MRKSDGIQTGKPCDSLDHHTVEVLPTALDDHEHDATPIRSPLVNSDTVFSFLQHFFT